MKSIGRDKIPGVSISFGQEFSKKSEMQKEIVDVFYILSKQFKDFFDLTNF